MMSCRIDQEFSKLLSNSGYVEFRYIEGRL